MNEKVRSFESRGGVQREEKGKKKAFCKLESLFFLLFFRYFFSFALQR
jgi:hypothetical protein